MKRNTHENRRIRSQLHHHVGRHPRGHRDLEAGRWDSLWFPDHFIPPQAWKGAQDEPIYEAWTLIAAAAGMTRKLRLGHLVTGNTYRNPALLAKMATTVDQVSHGRLTLSIGAAWFKREHEAYGWEYPSMRERQDRFEEACALIRALFTADGPVDFEGRFYKLDSAPLSPPSFQKPHIPIMVGGLGERRDTAHPGKIRRPVEPGRLRHGPRGCPSTWRNVPGPVQAQGRRNKSALRKRGPRSLGDQVHSLHADQAHRRSGRGRRVHPASRSQARSPGPPSTSSTALANSPKKASKK